jgi:hypothetical protein
LSRDPDLRDARDPEELGNALLIIRDDRREWPLSMVYDRHRAIMDDVVPYDPMPVDHSAAYRAELEARAALGDRFAISVLTTGEPGDEAE